MNLNCKSCKWKGVAEVSEKRQHGLLIRFVQCPKCGADLFSETLNGDEDG